MNIDRELIERTLFKQAPEKCIDPAHISALAQVLRQIPETRRELGKGLVIAVPEERSTVLRRLLKPALRGWLFLEMRWDVSVAEVGVFSSVRVFCLQSGEMLCVVAGRDHAVMRMRRMTVEEFARGFLIALINRDPSVIAEGPEVMNERIAAMCDSIVRRHAVPDVPLADGALCRSMLTVLAQP